MGVNDAFKTRKEKGRRAAEVEEHIDKPSTIQPKP
jgi:hypothetical protein